MRTPDALPLQMMLMMMQSQLSGGVSSPWSANSWNFENPFMPRLKTPLEQGTEWWQKQSQQASEQWLNLFQPKPGAKQKPEPWSAPPKPKGVEKPQPKSDASFTDALPHFFQPEFLQSLGEKAWQNSAGFMQGMQAYLTSDYERPEPDYKVIWKRGSARLLDLDPKNRDGVAVLCVPSLINKFYVLDLYPEASLVQYLKSQGFRPLILDWGTPGKAEMDFTAADYMTGYALDALQNLREQHDGPIALLGYCMGGIFAVAMTQLAQLYVDALILLATPWDFSAEDTPRVFLEPGTQLMLRQWIGAQNPVPPLVIQTVFHLINPWRVQEKYSRYLSLDAGQQKHFLAVEQWVNDGVPLPQKVAEEAFVDWPQGNILATHQWKVGRRWIEPNAITCPTLVVLPTKDAIVPLGVSTPLTREIPRCDILKPETGHVSMMVGSKAKAALWKPLATWLQEKF